MPSPYPGNPSATQSPSPPPADGSPPIVNLPADGDPPNAATWAQAYKVLADYAAFGIAPFANSGQWAQDVLPFANARLATKFRVDHAGLPSGHFLTWEESWSPSTGFSLGPGFATNGRWTYQSNIGTGAGGFSPQAPGAGTFNPWNNTRAGVLTIDGTATNRAEMRAEATTSFTDDAYCSVDIDFSLKSIVDVDWVIALSSTGETINAVNNGIFLIRPDTTGTNFLLRTISGGVTTQVDSGIPASAGGAHHLSLRWWGANVADDSAAHAVITLDSFSTHIDTNLPNAAGHPIEFAFGGFVTTASVANPQMIVGPVKFAQYTP